MLEEIHSFYNIIVLDIKTLENEFKDLIEEHDKLDFLVAKYLESIKCESVKGTDNSKTLNVVKNEDYYTLKSVCEEKSASKEYNNYIFSYFESCIVVRNEMITKSNTVMKYSYLFLLTHFFELVLKKVVIHHNESFKNNFIGTFSTHEILKIISNNEEQFLNLGLKKEYFDLALSEFEKISSFCNQTNDFQQSFKYPLKKDRITSSISDSLINTDINELNRLVESHKKLIFIGLIIYLLSSKENTIELNKMLSIQIEKLKLILGITK